MIQALKSAIASLGGHVRGSALPRAAFWLAAGAALCAAGLLLAFQRVVSEGTQRGVSRQHAVAARAEAAWRCDLPGANRQDAACSAVASTNP